jgi:hypothetical protein
MLYLSNPPLFIWANRKYLTVRSCFLLIFVYLSISHLFGMATVGINYGKSSVFHKMLFLYTLTSSVGLAPGRTREGWSCPRPFKPFFPSTAFHFTSPIVFYPFALWVTHADGKNKTQCLNWTGIMYSPIVTLLETTCTIDVKIENNWRDKRRHWDH